ncbi:MAG: phosphatidate cytidylyltransferase [Anaerolineales bacterium]|nr:phosphatidate cytidylyltransferase [Anaerolineales bacterium]
MLSDRLAITIPLLPLAVWIIWLGGWVYALVVAAVLVVAGREFVRIFRAGGHRPALLLVMVGAPLLALTRFFRPADLSLVFVGLIVASLVWHLADFENGAPASGTDFVITLGGIFYLGWMGSYFTMLRALPDGLWWTAVLMGAIWLADSAAYLVGRAFGRNLLAPRLSPRKTWEGFLGGIAGGTIGSAVLALLWRLGAGPESLVDWHTAGLLGALIGLVGPIGDLGISMLKREGGVKDSGAVIVGHGGALDRIDSWLVAIPVGYYAVLLLRSLTQK